MGECDIVPLEGAIERLFNEYLTNTYDYFTFISRLFNIVPLEGVAGGKGYTGRGEDGEGGDD